MQMRDLDDEQLMALAAARDEDAIGELYARHGARAWTTARRLVGNDETAREVVQDAFLGLWNIAPRYDSALAGVPTLLARLVRARAVDRLRRDSAVRRGPGDDVPLGEELGLAADDDVAADAERSESQAVVHRAIAALPTQQRVLVELCFLYGYSHAELSEALNLPLGTVKTRLFRALARLHARLADELSDTPPPTPGDTP